MAEFSYESDWGRYAFPEIGAKFAAESVMRQKFTTIDLNAPVLTHAGPPLVVNGTSALVNDETEHWLIVGETGFKKTRCVVAPLITILSSAKESFFVTDVKGELITNPVFREWLDSHNVRQVFLDFRDFTSDGYNILEHALSLYCQGNEDKAMMSVASIVSALSSIYDDTRADPFWKLMSEQHLIPVIHILFELAKMSPRYKQYVNMASVASFADESGTEKLREIFLSGCYKDTVNTSIQMLKNVLSAPEKTRMSIVATTASLLRDFMIQDKLMRMLSQSTFDVSSMYENPTCVFLILPDETRAYNGIGGLLLDVFYSQLIQKYSEKYQNKKEPPCRINFVLDEFCNVRINEMSSKISASRGRLMRFILIGQSLKQLEAEYPDSWSTILGNCKNAIFLQSSDPEMLEYISALCGQTYISRTGESEPLLPVSWLKRLKKCNELEEAIFIRDDIVFKADLPDISEYIHLKKYSNQKICQLPKMSRSAVAVYTPGKFGEDINSKTIRPPFVNQNGEVSQDSMDGYWKYNLSSSRRVEA